MSVDIERSFSICKNMLINNRRTLKLGNIKKCLIVHSKFTGKHFIIFTFFKILNIFFIV